MVAAHASASVAEGIGDAGLGRWADRVAASERRIRRIDLRIKAANLTVATVARGVATRIEGTRPGEIDTPGAQTKRDDQVDEVHLP